MNTNEYRAICNALISNHHKQMLKAAKLGNDTKGIAKETAILSKIKEV